MTNMIVHMTKIFGQRLGYVRIFFESKKKKRFSLFLNYPLFVSVFLNFEIVSYYESVSIINTQSMNLSIYFI